MVKISIGMLEEYKEIQQKYLQRVNELTSHGLTFMSRDI